jgi:hypothetical protein
MAEILSLAPALSASAENQQSVIKLLEKGLELAKKGEISSAIIILNREDGLWHEWCSSSAELSRDIGRVEITKQKLIANYLKDE